MSSVPTGGGEEGLGIGSPGGLRSPGTESCLCPLAQHNTRHPGPILTNGGAAPAFCCSPLWTTKGTEQRSSLLHPNLFLKVFLAGC